MSESGTLCSICRTRKPKRSCPGIAGNICSFCCGEGRETTIDCPLDCRWLWEAYDHAKPTPVHPEQTSEGTMEIDRNFAEEKQFHLFRILEVLAVAAKAESLQDSDVREALTAVAETYRVADSGLFYRPSMPNPKATKLAALILDDLAKTDWQNPLLRQLIEVVHRLAAGYDNGRSKCKGFVVFLYRAFPEPGVTEKENSVILA